MSNFETGISHLFNNNIPEAVKCFLNVFLETPDNVDALNNISLCYAIQGQLTEAIYYAKRAVTLAPENPMCLSNLGHFCKEIGDLEDSRNYLEKAYSLHKEPISISSLGLVNWELNYFSQALENFNESLLFDPNNVNMHVNKALIYLQLGMLQEGFKEYLWRIQPQGQMCHYLRCYNADKLWDGVADLTGKKFLVYGEQGNGDIIQFARYLPELRKRGAYVIFHIPKAIETVLGHLADELFCENIENLESASLPEYDFQCSTMSLPFLLKNFSIDGRPYIGVNSIKSAFDKKTIAVVWAGSPLHPNDPARSIPIDEFSKLFDVGSAHFYSLQFGLDEQFFQRYPVYDGTQGITDFGQTKEILEAMDLVISCDTSIAHLAGAMGQQSWVIVPYNCDWRWGTFGPCTDWYESVRVFRQHKPRDWSGVIQEVKQALLAF